MVKDLLSAALALAVAALVMGPLVGQLKRRPCVFYATALALVAAYLVYYYAVPFVGWLQIFVEPLRKGYIASFFLAAVMFIGALPNSSAFHRRLLPVRAELSILSFILYVPHVATYLPSYLPRLGPLFSMDSFISSSVVVAMVLTAVYLLLSLLSFKVFRARMPFKVWKGIQRLSYAMMALLLLHIWLVAGRSAIAGGSTDMTVVLVVYTAIVAVYAVLRIRKALLGRAGERAAEGA